MQYDYLETDEALADFCAEIAAAESIAFDTEFVSEQTYRPQLCLIQVIVQGRLVVIDPLAIESLDAFWRLMTDRSLRSVVFSGREELRFCLNAVGERPQRLIDLQIAAGLVGLEYPAAYRNIVGRLLNHTLPKGETRTDWRQRPLTRWQIEYALEDVIHLPPLDEELTERLTRMGRLAWLDEEMSAWQSDIEEAEGRQRWRRVKGLSGLSARSLAIVRELWEWREQEAARKNLPARWVLRDDLIVELARRQSADAGKIRALRGMERKDLMRHLPELSRRIEAAIGLPKSELPGVARGYTAPQLDRLTQFFTMALKEICHRAHVAPSIVGTADDVRELLAHRLGFAPQGAEPSRLTQGWRAGVVGRVLDDFLAGRLAVAVEDPLSDSPLVFEPRGEAFQARSAGAPDEEGPERDS